MLTFQPVTQRDLARLRSYYENCTYRLCEYSAGVKLMWRGHLRPQYAEAAGCLVIKNDIDGKSCFDYPVPGANGDEDAALGMIEEYCVETGTALSISVVPKEKAGKLLARYPHFRLSNLRTWRDYLYEAGNLCDFPGRHYSGQRNHVNKFRKLYPEARFRVLGKDDRTLIEQFWRDYEAVFVKESLRAKHELMLAKKMLRLTGKPYFCVGGMELDGRLISVCLAERCGQTLIDHIEKALYGYEGVYPVTVQEFARHFAVDGVRWINREDDAGDRGLRTSKLQYLPTELGEKLCFDVENELKDLTEIPSIRTERLTLSPLKEQDREAYNALCLDDERNKWWGYDYRKDWKGEDLADYFLNVTREDFARKLAVNFAVRLDGKCIGEVLLYRFDGKGGAEEGCRIAPEYAGHGYGTEAFRALAEWGLYTLSLSHIVAKCYRENESSYQMLSSCMRKSGEDETFCYFNKEV
ncbi:MAG: GNAT family N-acetyltransferase [Eubacteriales bacterium]|nr:GNAT family N-acetyltransferase [Eubacteriales bacterium]